MTKAIGELIRNLAQRDRIAFKKHSLLRMHQRRMAVDEVREALTNGEVIETYEKDKPLPSYLVLGYSKRNRAIHIVIGMDEVQEMLWVITVYEPSITEWKAGFMSRRK